MGRNVRIDFSADQSRELYNPDGFNYISHRVSSAKEFR